MMWGSVLYHALYTRALMPLHVFQVFGGRSTGRAVQLFRLSNAFQARFVEKSRCVIAVWAAVKGAPVRQ